MKITRENLINCIEQAIQRAKVLTPSEREALRKVGRESTLVARGDWYAEGCGCPIMQSGVVHPSLHPQDVPRFCRFAVAFDAATRNRNQGGLYGAGAVEVIG